MRKPPHRPGPLRLQLSQISLNSSPTPPASPLSLLNNLALTLSFDWPTIQMFFNSKSTKREWHRDGKSFSITYAGRTFKFEQTELLGEGNFGSVHQYKISEPDNKAAEPIIAARKICLHETTVEKEHETLIHKRYCSDGHPHIMQFRAADKLTYSFFCNYYPQSLQQYIEEHKEQLIKADADTCQTLITQVITPITLALNHLHNELVDFEPAYHADIKPANILLDESGNAVLADFGCTTPKSKITKEVILQTGTYELHSPERFLLEEETISNLEPEDCSKIIDAWQLGLLIKKILQLPTPVDTLAKDQDIKPGENKFKKWFDGQSRIECHSTFDMWARAYDHNYQQYLADEKETLASRASCLEFTQLNNLANALLAPIDRRPSIAQILTEDKQLNLDADWDEIASSTRCFNP